MVKWVLAMEVYERVNKVVVPKKVKLKEAEAELAEQMGKLRLKQAELQEVVDKLTAMENEYEKIGAAKTGCGQDSSEDLSLQAGYQPCKNATKIRLLKKDKDRHST